MSLTLNPPTARVENAPVSRPVSYYARAYVTERTARRELTGSSPRNLRVTLTAFSCAIGDPPVDRLSTRHVEKWLGRGPLSPATVRTQLSTVRNFCRWLVEREVIRSDPTARLRGPREPRRLPRNLQAEQVRRALAHCPDPRARVVVLLMCQEGLRCCEVAGLEVGDIDWQDKMLVVRKGKGGHERALPLSAETWRAIQRYLAAQPTYAGPLVRSYLDPTRGIGAKHVSRIVGEWLRDSGVKGRSRDGISAHALRHTMASDMLRHGAHLRDVQRALGHSSLMTTQRYLPLGVQELRQAMGGRTYQ